MAPFAKKQVGSIKGRRSRKMIEESSHDYYARGTIQQPRDDMIFFGDNQRRAESGFPIIEIDPMAKMCRLITLVFITTWISCPSYGLDRVKVSADHKGFALESTGVKFRPWGFNYDHDESGRLLEDYWETEWAKVVEDFHEMKQLGANVVRIHLQVGKFLESADRPNLKALNRLEMLFKVAEKEGLYLDLTGLGCYHKKDVPAWYDALSEQDRWSSQALFWSSIAARASQSSAIFCYDLMNEPVVPGGKRKPGDWLGPPFAGKHFVQVITLDQADRPRPEIAKKWIDMLAAAIRKQDPKGLITVGLVDWSLDRPGLSSGFVPSKVTDSLDFLCVHLYPESGKIDENLATLKGFAIGKPIVIEETFALKCSIAQFESFYERAQVDAAGWVGFYWGKRVDVLGKSGSIGDAILKAWLDWFVRTGKQDPR
jgi:hypothetical protein